MSKWFALNANTAEISILNDIGMFGVTAEDFHRELRTLGKAKKLRISISSHGGDVAAGFAIFNMLASHPAHKVVTVNGLAASMASVIAMAGDEIVMPKNSTLMIHNPWGSITGESDQIASFAEGLKIMQDNIVAAYQDRTGLPENELRAMMDKETWLSADSAVEMGFADTIVEPVKMAASAYNLRRFSNVPTDFGSGRKVLSLSDLHSRAWRRFNSLSRQTRRT